VEVGKTKQIKALGEFAPQESARIFQRFKRLRVVLGLTCEDQTNVGAPCIG
jgi:hypothetical protein